MKQFVFYPVRYGNQLVKSEWTDNPHVLELSTKSSSEIGRRLSAFNLKLKLEKGTFPVECVYQSAKVFGGNYNFRDWIYKTPAQAKALAKNRGDITGFRLEYVNYPADPPTAFYDWIYIRALKDHVDWIEKFIPQTRFSDRFFNPQKGVNCQAHSFALYMSLIMRDKSLIRKVASDFNFLVKILSGVEQ